MATKEWAAIETKSAIGKAVKDFQTLASEGAEALPGMKGGINWQPDFGIWSYFGKAPAKTLLGWRYWNVFGKMPAKPRSSMLVEINPPQSGLPKGTQGLIATDRTGRRWIFHGGRIHPPGKHVHPKEFERISGRVPVNISFSDNKDRPYFPVAPLDEGGRPLLAALRSFIETCDVVRQHFEFGASEADAERRVAEAEGPSNPEKGGTFIIPPSPGGIGERWHADVWNALVKVLDAKKLKHTNSRVGAYGPDLRTVGAPLVLFEIKTAVTASDIYGAVGQLVLYERILDRSYRKVLVLPSGLRDRFRQALADLGFLIVEYWPSGKTYAFNDKALSKCLK